jgi:DNA-binding transcriptional MerR regulator
MTEPEPSVPMGWRVAAVAERVGVSVSTLRSWERRYGLRPHGRTIGGHRRYDSADVAMLQRLRGLVASGMPTGAAVQVLRAAEGAVPSSDGAGPTPDDALVGAPDAAADDLRRAADDLDVQAIEELAVRVLTERGAVGAWTEVFVPVLQLLGSRWQSAGDGVECEHVVSGIVQSCLDRYAIRRRMEHGAFGAPVLLAATPAEEHVLPLHATAAALAEHGVTSCIAGSLPSDATISAVHRLSPAAVLLWARDPDAADVELLVGLRTRVPLVCAAGLGWPSQLPPAVPAAADLASAVQLLLAAAAR